ncbi:COX15/CtaA family protein [Robiginitalea sp. M366]|uniref:COX15/CtaA family protein n=1 Tax=Robiginitalea aestuariiviva TaxID=3036903 RepID=UPI00240E04FB|nr:COX15/CtaA family protein [Robiginitalea aestuariiviva]MDG1572362.1 COX15/CtaA family protein [Robiginitalea aestuariiviva]
MRTRAKKGYYRMAQTALVLVYLVILAGAVVRMTGSGMGCPDWPKCFGYLIPPTEASELEWTRGREYQEGQVIIFKENLLLAREDFTARDRFDPANWEPYTKHDYAIFNAAHTWTEYINRLLGALSGLAILGMALFSLAWWPEKKGRVLFAWLTVIAIGFQAWLGATVVYSVLAPVRITLHMFMALVIVAMLTWIVFRDTAPNPTHRRDPFTFGLWGATVLLSLLQILMGSQVRQYVDEQADLLGEGAREFWLMDPATIFLVHRSFSIIVVLLHLWVGYRIYSRGLGYRLMWPVLTFVGLILLSGIAMNYLAFPFGSQPVHLVMAALLFGAQWYLWLQMRQANQTRISS